MVMDIYLLYMGIDWKGWLRGVTFPKGKVVGTAKGIMWRLRIHDFA